jgi:hypothetical protein
MNKLRGEAEMLQKRFRCNGEENNSTSLKGIEPPIRADMYYSEQYATLMKILTVWQYITESTKFSFSS